MYVKKRYEYMTNIKITLTISLLLCFLMTLFCISKHAYSQGKTYTNKEYGFTIDGPESWLEQLGPGGPDGIVTFIKKSDAALPKLCVTIDTPGNIQSVLDYANGIIQSIKAPAKARQATLRILEQPHEVIIRGIKGSKAVYELVGPANVKYADWKFMKDDLIISIIGGSYSTDFENDLKDFDNTVNSLIFLKE